MKTLVIDDDKSSLTRLSEYIQKMHFQPLTANTGKPDLVGAASIALGSANHRGRNQVCQTTSFDSQDS